MLSQLKEIIKELRPIRDADYIGLHRTRSLAKVGSITILEQAFMGGSRLLTIVLLSRLLPVSVFGLIAIVAFFELLLQTISGSGIIESIIQARNLQAHQVAGIFWINTGIGFLLATCLALSGPLIATFYNEPQLTLIAAAMGALFFFKNIPQTQSALLRRSMRAETQTCISILTSIVNLVSSVAFAFAGWGVWAIISGTLVALMARQALVSYFVRFNPWIRFNFKDLRPMVSYGLKATFGNVVGFLTLNIQTLALGKYASTDDVGFYNRAQGLYQQPLKQLVWPLVGVALPAMSALQGDRKKLLSLVNRATWLLNLVLSPFAILMIVAGDLVIGLLLGPEWTVSGEVIRWVAIAQIPLMFNTPLTRANSAIGRPARSVWLNVALLPVIVGGVIHYATSGVVMVSIYLMFVRLATYPIFLYLNLKSSGMPAITYIKSLLPLLAFLLLATISGLMLRSYFDTTVPQVQVLFVIGIPITTFGLLYLVYRRTEIGVEVLRWVYSRFGSKSGKLKGLVP